MLKQEKAAIKYYQSELLLQNLNIGHFFSTRHGDFNALKDLAKVFEISDENIVIGKQTHSDQIAVITNENKQHNHVGIDAFITMEQNIGIAVKTADCTPILLFDPIKSIVAAVHSGWRGTIQNIAGKTIEKMVREFQVSTDSVLAAIGPCIGVHHYEVGEEVASQFRTLFSDNNKVVKEPANTSQKARISVSNAILQQLIDAGIKHEHIDFHEICTYDNDGDFHSARRDGPSTGRMVNCIWLK